MYKLTDRRLVSASSILDAARASLVERGSFNVSTFEHKLRETWDIGYQEIKDVMIDIVKRHPRYKFVAIYFMENSNSMGVVCEFQSTLAKEYGIDGYSPDEVERLSSDFWKSAMRQMKEDCVDVAK